MQQRMTFVDTWNTIEQACLASAVRTFGETETNWAMICNYLRSKFSLTERPGNWLTPESCEAQYKWLSDKYVRMEISCERPVNQILQNLKQIAKQESQIVLEQENKYKESKEKIESFAKNEIDFDTAMVYYEEAFKRNKEREENLRKFGLKNESFSKFLVKQDNKTDGSSPLTTSPLLSSLLNNPPAVQYRPTLSTASFIPAKTTQGTSRASFDKAHISDISHKNAYSPNVGSQSSPLSERSSMFSSPTSSARKLDFQDPSTSSLTASNEQLSSTKGNNKDVITCDETIIKSNIQNLENVNLIPTTEEYLSEVDIPQEMLLQVIGNLEGKQLLDKVLDELTGEKDVIIEKDLTSVSIPLNDSFITSNSTKDSVPITNLASESNSIHVSPLTSDNFESTRHQYEATTQDVIIIGEEQTNEQVVEETNISHVEQPVSAEVETVTINTNSSSFSSVVAISSASESVSESKSDSEPLVEYLGTNSVEKDAKDWQPENNIQVNENLDAKSIIKTENINTTVGEIDTSDETRESAEGYATCESTPDKSETCDILKPSESSLPEKKLIIEISDIDVNETLKTTEKSVEEIKEESKEQKIQEVTTDSDISLGVKCNNRLDIDNIPLKELQQIEKEKLGPLKSRSADNDTNSLKITQKTENVDKIEDLLPEIVASPTKISKPVLEMKETVNSSVLSSTLPTIMEGLKPTKVEEEPVEGKPSSPAEVIESQEEAKSTPVVKNRRRRRRSTVSESNEVAKIAKVVSEEVESTEEEEVSSKKVISAKEINITIKDFQTEGLDSEITDRLLKPKEEITEEVPQTAEVSPAKTKIEKEKPVNKSVDTKKIKQRLNVGRRSSIRTQNQNISSPKIDDASPSTPVSRNSDIGSTKKKSLVLAHQRLATQKYSSAFLKPISNKNVAGYEDVIYNPIDLQTIKRKIDNRQISTVTEFQRDVLLMILNAKMFNPINSQVYNMAVEMQKEALREIQLTVQTLGEGVLFEVDDVSEKARKRQSIEVVKKEQKTTKRSKLSTREENTTVKKIKLEENEATA